MKVRMMLSLSALTVFASGLSARADSFEDLWLTRIKPPPYGGVATEFDDTVAADGKQLHPYRDMICAHMLEQMGQRLRVTNVANGKSVICTVADKGPSRAPRDRSDTARVQGDRLRRHVRGECRAGCEPLRSPAVPNRQRLRRRASPSYSITSSAVASSDGGTGRPSVLAVLRLITSSNLVGCKTGRSAGLAPLRI
jgi:hypothetical protein